MRYLIFAILVAPAAWAKPNVMEVTQWGHDCSFKIERACEDLRQACEEGDGEACYQRAIADGIRGDDKAGLAGIQKACNKNHPNACELFVILKDLYAAKDRDHKKDFYRIQILLEVIQLDRTLFGLSIVKRTFEKEFSEEDKKKNAELMKRAQHAKPATSENKK